MIFILDFYKHGAGNHLHREEFSAVSLSEATKQALEFIPKVEAEFGPMDKVIVYGNPYEGDLIVWKVLKDGAIARLMIPKEAKRIPCTYEWNQIKCEYAKVLNIYNSRGREIKEAISDNDNSFKYRVGEIVYPTVPYTHKTAEYPSPGIYVYYTREQARLHLNSVAELDDYRPIFNEFGRFLQKKAVQRGPGAGE